MIKFKPIQPSNWHKRLKGKGIKSGIILLYLMNRREDSGLKVFFGLVHPGQNNKNTPDFRITLNVILKY